MKIRNPATVFLFLGSITFGVIFHKFLILKEPQLEQKTKELNHPTKSSHKKPVSNSNVTNQTPLQTSEELILASTLLKAREQFPSNPIASIELIGTLGLPRELTHSILAELAKNLEPNKAFEILRSCERIPNCNYKYNALRPFIEKALPGNEGSVIEYLSQHHPPGLFTASRTLWKTNPQEAEKHLRILDGQNAQRFLLGAIRISEIQPPLDLLVEKVRSLKSSDRIVIEAEILEQSIATNASAVEHYLTTAESSQILNQVLPKLAIVNSGGDLNKALQWLEDFEGREDSPLAEEVKELWELQPR